MGEPSNVEGKAAVACSAWLAAFRDLDEAWGEMLHFGNHDGECSFSGECEKCGGKLGGCGRHAEHMALRVNGMTAALNRMRALVGKSLPAGPKRLGEGIL